MSQSGKIAVILTLYNDYSYLAECVSSLETACQNSTDVLVVFCVDDSLYNSDQPHNQATLEAVTTGSRLEHTIVFNHRGGPSRARNLGVDYCLKERSDVSWFYFMDADNFLTPGGLDRMRHALEKGGEKAGYTYQDIHQFGEIENLVRLDIPFNKWRLFHDFYGETGNLVRRAVFESGVRWKEEMTIAGEDVEFFRQIARTWRGIYAGNGNFFYRVKKVSRHEHYFRDRQEMEDYIRENQDSAYRELYTDFFSRLPAEALDLSAGPQNALTTYITRLKERQGETVRSFLQLAEAFTLVTAGDDFLNLLRATPFSGVFLTSLFVPLEEERCLLFRFEKKAKDTKGENPPFVYSMEETRLGNLEKYFHLGIVSSASLENWLVQGEAERVPCKLITIKSDFVPEERRPVLVEDFRALLSGLRDAELGDRNRLETLEKERGYSTPPVFKFENHHSWLRGQIRSNPIYLDGFLAWVDGSSYEKSPPRVAVLAPFIGVGGSDIAIMEIIRGYRQTFPGHKIHLILSHFIGSESGSDQGRNNHRLDWVLDSVDSVVFTDFLRPGQRKNFLSQLLRNYDLLHLETAEPPYHVLKDVRKNGRQPRILAHYYCWDHHNGMRVGFPVFGREFGHIIDAYSCQTGLLADYFSTWQVPPEKIFHIPYQSRFRAEPGFRKPENPVLNILWIGRWGIQKNPRLLTRVVEKLLAGPDRNIKFTLLVLRDFDNALRFDRSEYDRLKRLVEAQPEQVEIIEGAVNETDLQNLYRQADILLNTSLWEGIPFTFYEAMEFLAIPVVTDVSGNREIILDGKTGFLCPSGETEPLVKRLRELASRPELVKSLREGIQAGREPQKGGENTFVKGHLKLAQALLNKKPLPGADYCLDPARMTEILEGELVDLKFHLRLEGRGQLAEKLPADLTGPLPVTSGAGNRDWAGVYARQRELKRLNQFVAGQLQAAVPASAGWKGRVKRLGKKTIRRVLFRILRTGIFRKFLRVFGPEIKEHIRRMEGA